MEGLPSGLADVMAVLGIISLLILAYMFGARGDKGER